MINLLPEIEGKLPEDKDRMLAVISRFQALYPEERENFKLGRRLGLYNRLDDMKDTRRYEEVQQVVERLGQDDGVDVDQVIFNLMGRFI